MRMFLSRRWLVAHAAVLVVVVTCVQLGLWQLRRHDARRTYNALVAKRSLLPPTPLAAPTGLDPSADVYRRAEVRGTYDGGRQVILAGRTFGGRAGHHVLTPLVTASGAAILVDRGWVSQESDDPTAVALRPPPGEVRVDGVLIPPEGRAPFAPAASGPGPVRRLTRLDLERIARQVPYPLAPLAVRLRAQEPPVASPAPVPLARLEAGPHRSYAGQWFLFGVVALVGYAFLMRRARRDAARAEV